MMRAITVILLIACLTGCKQNVTPKAHRPGLPSKIPSTVYPNHVIDLASVKRPAPTTAEQKLAEIRQIWKGQPAGPQGSPSPMSSLDINVSAGYASINSQTLNAEAWLIFGNAGDVFFYPNEGGYPNMGFADFAIHPPNIQEPDVQIWTGAYPATSALVDCTVDGWNTGAPPVFEFDQGASVLGPWTSTSIVTPSAGHVFYGFSIPPLDSFGGESTVIIRLEPTPDSPNIVWRFWGCELTYISQ
jgi:hypothetical protein